MGILAIALVWSKVPKPIFTKPKTEPKAKVIPRNWRLFLKKRSQVTKIIFLVIGVCLWVIGIIIVQVLSSGTVGLCIYFIGWAPYILGAWVL